MLNIYIGGDSYSGRVLMIIDSLLPLHAVARF